MARAIASATISFGLVSIPVSLYSATQASASVSFNLLHAKCGTRLRQQYICPLDNEIVSRDQMIKGYEFAKDRYVTFTTDELKALEEKATQAIEIAEFVPFGKIDPVYFDKPYYLGPEKGGEKAYRLLAEVMKESGRAAIARYAARGKQYIVMLRPADGIQGGGTGLVMQTLLYADEVRSISEVPIPVAEVRASELNLARQLVDQIAAETFSPADYEDDVRKRMLADIQRKVEGQEIATSPPPAEPAQIIDLMEALKASLGQSGGARRALGSAPRAGGHPDAAAGKSSPGSEAEAPDALENRKPARRAKAEEPSADDTAAAADTTATTATASHANKTEHRKRASKR
jgi:DNA end-binding protein Ku